MHIHLQAVMETKSVNIVGTYQPDTCRHWSDLQTNLPGPITRFLLSVNTRHVCSSQQTLNDYKAKFQKSNAQS